MSSASKIFLPSRSLGYVSNHIPLQVRYINSRKENLIVTCVGKAFHTYGISHFSLLSVSGLHPEDITAMTSDAYHVYTACENEIYAWRRGHELKHVYRGHAKPVHAMLPFGVHLISVDEGSAVKVWDIKGESVYVELMFANESFRITALLHPSTYINKVLFGSEQGELQLWNLKTTRMIYTFKGWRVAVRCLEQAPAIDVVAIGLNNGTIKLHNLKYDRTVMEFTQDWGAVTGISFRTDGHPIMATASTTGHIVFWDLEERRVSSQLMHAHGGAVNGLICLPNEPLVLSSSEDNTLKLWIFDMTDGSARLLRIREGHSSSPSFIRFHGANGHNILSAAGDSTLRIFNTQTEQFNKSLGKASYNRKISKKKKRTVEDPLVMPPIIEFTSETTREKEWDNIAAMHLGLPMVTTWSYDKLKMGAFKLLPERLQKKNKPVDVQVFASSLCLTHCGNFVIVGYSDGHVDRFNIQSGYWRDSYGEEHAHQGPVRGVACDNLNKIVVTGGSDCCVKFWLFKTKRQKHVKTVKVGEGVHFFRSHNESSMLAVALEDFTILIVDLDTKIIVREFKGHTGQLTDATFSPDSRWLISAGMDCSIRTWNIPAAHLVDQFRTEAACVSLNMAPTGECLATAHIDHLGVFLWTNRTLYVNTTLSALSAEEEPPLMALPEVAVDEPTEEEQEVDNDDDEFKSPQQISGELITLSGLASSRWQNLLNLDVIKNRNKPKEAPKAPKAAPFFLPTIPSLNFQFDLKSDSLEGSSRLLTPSSLLNLSPFGRLLDDTQTSNDFTPIVDKLKSMGPSMIDFEVKSLSPDVGGSIEVMLQFLKCIEVMLQSNRDFELAQAYLGVFLKSHGPLIMAEERLRNYLPNVQSCHSVGWERLRQKLFYSLSIVQNLKTT